MRLERTLKSGGGLRGLALGIAESLIGFRAHMAWVQARRPAYLGRAASAWTHGVMRCGSAWTASERELFASFTSRVESCPF